MQRLSVALILLASLAASALAAAEPKVYKWTDENGTVHYSAEAPAAGAQEVPIDKAPTIAPADAAAVTPVAAKTDPNAKVCQQHRTNLALLENPDQPLSTEDGSSLRPMTGRERAEQLDIARAALAECERLEQIRARIAATPPAPAPAPAPAPKTPPAH